MEGIEALEGVEDLEEVESLEGVTFDVFFADSDMLEGDEERVKTGGSAEEVLLSNGSVVFRRGENGRPAGPNAGIRSSVRA